MLGEIDVADPHREPWPVDDVHQIACHGFSAALERPQDVDQPIAAAPLGRRPADNRITTLGRKDPADHEPFGADVGHRLPGFEEPGEGGSRGSAEGGDQPSPSRGRCIVPDNRQRDLRAALNEGGDPLGRIPHQLAVGSRARKSPSRPAGRYPPNTSDRLSRKPAQVAGSPTALGKAGRLLKEG